MSRPDGGPAFPRGVAGIDGAPVFSYDAVNGVGMSLRDYFAAHAPALTDGQLASLVRHLVSQIDTLPLEQRIVSEVVKYAYLHADAMLAEREKQA